MRDASSKTYALMLKSRLLGEIPAMLIASSENQAIGGPSRQGGGVSGIEIALWDLAGKAYGVPLYQLLGGRFRDKVRVYCDTDVDANTPVSIWPCTKETNGNGFYLLKMTWDRTFVG